MNSYLNVNEGEPMTLDKAIRMERSTREDGRWKRHTSGRVQEREPRLWEELRKTTVSSPGGVAPLVGRQVPSIECRGHSLATKRHKRHRKDGGCPREMEDESLKLEDRGSRKRWEGSAQSAEYRALKIEVGRRAEGEVERRSVQR